jgi:uncharacterized protein YbaA (DUF1428 family)
MTYVDGFVIPLAKTKVKAYTKMAQMGKRAWMKCGALAYYECQGDALKAMPGAGNFLSMAKAKPNETVFFSFIVFKNKAHRDAVNKRVMKQMDEEMKKNPMSMKDMPFNPKRMAYGGFKTVVQG